MKIRIEDIYNDNQTLFTNNNLINSDERLNDITDLNADLDLIIEMSFGNREIFKRFLSEDDTEIYKYNLSKIQKSIYATLVENLLKYETMLKADEEFDDIDPSKQFFEHDVIGERVRENDIKSRVDTTTHGNVNTTKTFGDVAETNTHGTINTSMVTGQAVNTMQNGQRVSTDAVTSFSNSTFKDTDKSTVSQTTDTQTLGTHTDTEQITQGNDGTTTTHGNDTEQITRGQDSVNYGAHKDVITDTESVDEKWGFNDLVGNLESRRRYVNRNTLNEIINDVLNSFTYGLYTF